MKGFSMQRTMTEQELFWKNEFGDDYIQRNNIQANDRRSFFSDIFTKISDVESICELGANKGHNLEAIYSLNQGFKITGVELNRNACEKMSENSFISVVNESIQDFVSENLFDFVFVCGVLIHLNPDDLNLTYEKIYNLSKKYILISEYYNPTPVAIEYRGHKNKLFKRDFGGEFWDSFKKEVELVDYGFLWQKVEPAWDNVNWWLFKKV